eukprot:2626366-Amphidinium_carterae.1
MRNFVVLMVTKQIEKDGEYPNRVWVKMRAHNACDTFRCQSRFLFSRRLVDLINMTADSIRLTSEASQLHTS